MKILFTLLISTILISCGESKNQPISPNTPPTKEKNLETNKNSVSKQSQEIQAEPVKSKPVVTLTKYFDFACGYCRKGAQTVRSLKEKYGDQIELEFRHFVVHPSVLVAHKAVACAGEQGKFETYFYEYFENHFAQTNKEKLIGIAEKSALDIPLFEQCLESNRPQQIIAQHQNIGQLVGIRGTPNFVINNETRIPGALPQEKFEEIIDEIILEQNQLN